ncbi:hypothetical protein Shyd_57910 [Streptomyces hydrogenans]|uniref:Integrase n=1 Tax=Streptomyces hydrogenans TaxID=1873719 RepID=A0ABQ3PHB8_9ACTN|nr:hypothetical protein Shyd_57910 [Streptomyces hydrogenans]
MPIAWTGHSLRIGLASVARRSGRDSIAIADQGGWARHSRSMLGYMQREDGWDDTPLPASPDPACGMRRHGKPSALLELMGPTRCVPPLEDIGWNGSVRRRIRQG